MPRRAKRRRPRPYPTAQRLTAELRNLGALVRTLRMARGWTLEEASERMRIDMKHLQRLETTPTNVGALTLLRIAAAFDETFTLPGGLSARALMKYPHTNPLPDEPMPGPPPRPERAPEDLVRDVGLRLSELRIQRGLTQRELAKAAGVPASLVERVERGRYKGVSLRSLARLATAIGSTVEVLLTPPTMPQRGRGRPPRLTAVA